MSMKIGILGTGVVGRTIGTKLISLGHEVEIGSRTPERSPARRWVLENGNRASLSTLAGAASFGELLFNCTAAVGAIEALRMAGEGNIVGKILIDTTNPFVDPGGTYAFAGICATDSLGEQIQRAFPHVRLVKTLNTVSYNVMVEPSLIPGEHDMFVSGNDPSAKDEVIRILKDWFGWKSVIDLGDITGARSQESILPFLIRLMRINKSSRIGIKITR